MDLGAISAAHDKKFVATTDRMRMVNKKMCFFCCNFIIAERRERYYEINEKVFVTAD